MEKDTPYKRSPGMVKLDVRMVSVKQDVLLFPGRAGISERPAIIEERTRIDDWEGDTVHGQDATLVTLVERKSRLTLIGKTANKTAEVLAARMSELLKKMDKVYTITLDNGGEFSDHAKATEAVNVNNEYAFMASIRGKMTSNSWLLQGVLIPDEDQKSDAIRS